MKVVWNGIIKQVYVETSEEEVAPDNSDINIVDTKQFCRSIVAIRSSLF